MTITTETAAQTHRYTWPSIVVAVVFGILYAYVLWTAVGNLIQLPTQLGDVTPWWLLILDVAMPVIVYVVAFLLGRPQALGVRIVFFFLGATVLSAVTVSSIAYVQTH